MLQGTRRHGSNEAEPIDWIVHAATRAGSQVLLAPPPPPFPPGLQLPPESGTTEGPAPTTLAQRRSQAP